MSNKKLKLAVMGGSGVGKSIFFASFFNYKMRDDEGRYTIRIPNQNSLEHISEMIESLFIKRTVLSGTDKRYKIDFHVSELDTTISLNDLPGGWTTEMKDWQDKAKALADDLQSADGVIFFISVEDLQNEDLFNKKTFQELSVYSVALSYLRNPKENQYYRADIPACIIFTKGDTAPDVELDQLESRIKVFLKNVQIDTSDKLKWFRVGKNLKCWKTVSIGQWEGPDKPPAVDAHENVVEPMDWLIEGMVKEKQHFLKKNITLIVSTILFIALLLFALLCGFDYYQWKTCKNETQQLADKKNFPAAFSKLDDFENRVFSAYFLPSFLESGKDLSLFRTKLKKRAEEHRIAEIRINEEQSRKKIILSEKEHFKSVKVYIDGVDWTKLPQHEAQYYIKGIDALQGYLDHDEYYMVASGHYSTVKSVLPYWSICHYMRSVDLTTEQGSLDPQEVYSRIRSLLEVISIIPERWKGHIASRIHSDLNAWLNLVPVPETTKSASNIIAKAQVLKNHPNLPQELTDSIKQKLDAWNHQVLINLWGAKVKSWLNEASESEPKIAIKFLNDRLGYPDIPIEFRGQLQDAISAHWERRVDKWLQDIEGLNPKDAMELLNRELTVSGVPSEFRDRLEKRIDFFQKQIINDELNNIKKIGFESRNLKEIVKNLMPEIKTFKRNYPDYSSDALEIIGESTGRVLNHEFKEIERKFCNCLSADDFECARKIMSDILNQLRISLSNLDSDINISHFVNQVEKIEKGLEHLLLNAEYESAKKAFNNLKMVDNPSDDHINKVIGSLTNFMDQWPRNNFEEIKKVKLFLEAIRGGLTGNLTIVSGNFKEYGGILEGDEIKVEIFKDRSEKPLFRTKIVESYIPSWNERIPITWTPRCTFKLKAIEVDTYSDDTILETTIYSNKIFGYEKLNGDVVDSGNTIKIKFDAPVPKCPWQ